ncbi:MAG: hypothetical protein FWF77_00475, partial [Defluviitaleaceae bacterium]|nr:hypothetical protein [Defluviitaleaceae bacterium]
MYKKIFARLILVPILITAIIFTPTAQAFALTGDGASPTAGAQNFDEMLDTLRHELFSPRIRQFGAGRRTVIDETEIPHKSPPDMSRYLIPVNENYAGIAPFFTPVNYVVGSRRQFNAFNLTSGPVHYGELVRQGSNVNIWILDSVTSNRPTDEQLDEAIIMYDEITSRMTRDFAPFAGVEIVTPFSNMTRVGDIHQDGRVNVLFHNGFSGGYFWSLNFMTIGGNDPIAIFHMNPSSWDSAPLFAHELQHLLFYMHFGVYAPNEQEFLWLNEALSMLAMVYWAEAGVARFQQSRFFTSAENHYSNPSDGRVGDFLNFNNSAQNYSMSMQHSMLMQQLAAACYAGAMYEFFAQNFPPTTNGTAFWNHFDAIEAMGMTEVVGNAFASAGLTGSTGATGDLAFDLLYFIFMEAFASDGGTIRGSQTPQFWPYETFSAFNLWGIRPGLGIPMDTTSPSPIWGSNGVTMNGTSFFNLGARTAFAQLPSGGNISLSGYNGTPPRGASLDMFYRLSGETAADPVLNISINDPDSRTRYYIVVPSDPAGSISGQTRLRHGQDGATVHVLTSDGAPNLIDIGGRTAYLFVATLFRNVNAAITYNWQAAGTLPTEFLQINGQGQYTTRAAFQPALQAALNTSLPGATVEVTGSLEVPAGMLTINIPANRTVLWNADYSSLGPLLATQNQVGMISLTGAGTFILGPAGNLAIMDNNTEGGCVLHAQNSVSIIIEGGSLINDGHGGCTIHLSGSEVTLMVESGLIRGSGANGSVISAVFSRQVIINGGTIEGPGSWHSVISSGSGSLVINGGTINNFTNEEPTVRARGNVAVLLTNAGAMALGAGSRISRASVDATAYFIGDHAALFEDFTPGTDLFRLDTPTLSQTNLAIPVANASATLTERLAIPDGGITVNGVPAGGTYIANAAEGVVTFGGTFYADDLTLTVSGATLADGR